MNKFNKCCIVILTAFLVFACNDSKPVNYVEIQKRINIIQQIYDKGETKRAFSLSQKLLNEYPSEPIVKVAYFTTQLQLYKIENEKDTKLIEESLSGLNQAYDNLSKNPVIPKDALMQMRLGYAMLLKDFGYNKRAISEFKKHYDQNFDFVMQIGLGIVVVQYAEALSATVQLEEARSKYAQQQKIIGDEFYLIYNMIKLESENGYFDKALAIADNYLEKHPYDPDIAFEKCKAYKGLSLFEESKSCFEELSSKIGSDDPLFKEVTERLNSL